MMVGPSGTRGLGLSGTARSDDREPESPANDRHASIFRPLNNANRESFGFLLTATGLCKTPGCAARGQTLRRTAADPPLTHVTLVWRANEHEDWLRFGKPVVERIIDRRRRVESYVPGQVFALVRWASNTFGTIRSTLDIVRAVGPGEAFTTLAQVEPGGELLLSVRGWAKVRAVLRRIDAIEQAGHDPCLVAPDHWRHIGNRLASGLEPRGYRHDRHRAWHLRRKLNR